MPLDLAMRKMQAIQSNTPMPEDEDEEEYFDDEPDYDPITADEMHSAAWEQHASLHR